MPIFTLVELGMNVQHVPLLQVHDLPSRFMSVCGHDYRRFWGCFVKVDPNRFTGVWRSYMRVLVSLDVRQPLKLRMKIKKMRKEKGWVNFKHEKLSTCFLYRVIGHSEKFCDKFSTVRIIRWKNFMVRGW